MPYAPPVHRPTTGTAPVHAPPQREVVRENDHGSWYSNQRWRAFRSWYLSRGPLCVLCEEAGRVSLASELHHVIPRLTRPDLAYSADNMMALCKSCHSRQEKR